MSSAPALARAKLIPFEGDEESPSGTAVELDFNPETLQFEVSNSLGDNAREPNRQAVGKATATLSFEALFDHTRPHERVPVGGDPETLDVRRRTEALLLMLAARRGDQGEKPSPQRVRFHWGAIIFDGVLERYSETLQYFSPEGVPLRASLSVTLTEQQYQYEALEALSLDRQTSSASEVARRRKDALAPGGPGPGGLFSASLDLQFDLDLQAEFNLSAGLNVDASLSATANAQLGLNVEADLAASLGVAVGADLAGEVLGQAFGASVGAELDLGAATSAGATRPHADDRATAWSADAPRQQTRAWQLAAALIQQARSGQAPHAAGDEPTGLFQRSAPLRVAGSPPLRFARPVQPTPAVLVKSSSSTARPTAPVLLGPSWERLAPRATQGSRQSKTNCCSSLNQECGCHDHHR